MEIEHKDGGAQCDIESCENKAIVNIQSGYMRYPIDEDGNYEYDAAEFVLGGDTNEHRCEDHEND